MLEFAHIALGTGDGLSCTRCAPARAATYVPADELSARIRVVAERWNSGPGPNIILGGPEPFAHPELPSLVAAAVAAGVERICLETDGGALSVPANASGVLRAGVRHLHVRLLAADTVLADELSGIRGRAGDALAGIGAFLESADADAVRVAVTALVPVCQHNLTTLPATIAALARHGLHAVRLIPGGPLPSGADSVLAAACDTGMVNQLWVEVDPALPLPSTHALHAVRGDVRDG